MCRFLSNANLENKELRKESNENFTISVLIASRSSAEEQESSSTNC